MKKLNSFNVLKVLLLSFTLVFTACENFLGGGLLKEALEDQIEYSQATATAVTVSARPETVAQIVPTIGDHPYKKGDPITLRFIASDGYMFNHWEANPANLINFENSKEINTTAKLTEYADKVNIYPVCIKRPEVVSFEPRNTDGVHYKNSHIKIEFDQELSEENDFSQISISMNGNSLQDSFFAPEWDKASKKIIIRANTKYINLKSETETVYVKIPGSFYFIQDGQKVEIGKDKTFTYTINSATNEKAEISFELDNKDSGTLTYTQKTDSRYNIGETININYKPAEDWVFFGWNVENGEGIVRIADDSELKTTVEVLSQSVDTVKINPVTFKRPKASFSPEKNDAGVPKNSSVSIMFTKPLSRENDLSKISITMDSESVLEHFFAPEWVDDGKEILFQANNEKPIDYTATGTKSIVVKVPADFYYEENGYKINFSEEQVYTYKINSKTNVTTKINFGLNDVSSGRLNPSSQSEYNLGDKIQVSFTPDSDWQFIGWKHNGGSSVIKLTETGDYTAEVEVLRASTELVEITPVVYKRLRLASSEPKSQTNGVPKDTQIVLIFTNPIPETEQAEALIKQISVRAGDEDLIEGGNFWTPEISKSDRTKVTIDATTKYIDITSGTRVVTVSVPAELYYEEEGNKIYAGKNLSFSYRVNPETCEKTAISFELDEDSSGKLTPATLKEYNLGDKIQISFKENADWQFVGWNNSDKTGAIKLTETGDYTAEVEVLKHSTETVVISPVIYKRLRLDSVLPENKSDGVAKNSQIVLNFTEPLSNSTEIKDLLKKIIVKAGEENLIENGNFNTPVISGDDRTKVEITATSTYIELTSGTRTVTVTVPEDFYYEKDGNKIYAGKNLSYSYRVNPETYEKTNIKFERVDTKSGELNPIGSQSYNLGEHKTVNFVMDTDSYRFNGWYCSNTDAVKLITNNLGVGYDDNGFNASTGVATAYFEILRPVDENDPVVIKPQVEKIPTMNIYAESKYGRFSQSIGGSYKEGTVVSLNFTSDSDYQFIKWQIKNKNTKEEINNWTEESGGYIKIADLENSNTTFSLVQAAAADSTLELLIEPVCAKRPKVVSWSPQYTTKGDMRDRTLVVMFNSKMDESSIYYDDQELIDLGVISEETKLPLPDYGVLEKEGDRYGYYKTSNGIKDDNSIVFKNIRICKLNDQNVNLLKYYDKPVFDKGNTGTLRIPTKITDESQDKAPPKYSEILVTLETGVNTKNGEANVNLSEEFSWAYFTNTDTDSKPPVFADEEIQINIAEEGSSDYNSVKTKTPLTEFKNTSDSITKDISKDISENAKTYNPKEGYIWVEMSIADEGSGVDVVNGILTKVNNKYYPNESNKNETLTTRIRFTLGGSANSATVSEKINLKDYNLKEGLYTLSFEAVDKNAHIALSKYEYQFIYDNEAPKAPKQSDLKEIRKLADTSSLFWTNPQEKDFASVKVISKNIDDTEELDHENSFNFDSSLYKTGIQYENLIPDLEPYKHYSHKLIISDYAGNETEVDVPVDYEKPVKIKDLKESRTTTNSATLTWTKPSEDDFGKVVIKRVNKTAAEKGETPDDDTIYVLSTASQENVYTARNFNRYEYTATVVDYSGNESEPETITDIKKPAKASSLAETRSSRTNATVNWTCDADVGKVKIDCYMAEKMPNGSDKETLVSSDEVNTFDKKYIDYTTLINGVRYVYKVTTTDYSGNTNEEIVQYTDTKAPAKVSSVTNRRESSGYETITWTKPTDSDFDHVRIVQYDTRDNSLKFDNVTVEKTYNSKEFSGLKNLHKYKYLVYTVDFAGNENPSYYSFQDDEKPMPVTDVYSGGRNGKIEIYFDVPGNRKMSQVELTGSYIEAISVSSSGANDFKKTFTDLGNGASRSFTLRVVDYSGNKSDAVSFTETSGAGVGKICHTPSGQDALCSINVYKNKNPVGVVCNASSYGSIFIWGIGEEVGKPWGDTKPRACSDDELEDYYKNKERYSGYEAKVNMASGSMWYSVMMNKLESDSEYLKQDNWKNSIWNWVRNKNNGSSVKWFIPSVGEYKYIMDNYNSMTNAYKALSDNEYSGTIVETGQPYWVASPRYYNSSANVVEFNSRHIEPDTGKESGKCDWLFYENNSSNLYKMYMTSDERDGRYFEKTDTEEDWAYVHAHAMGTISMW